MAANASCRMAMISPSTGKGYRWGSEIDAIAWHEGGHEVGPERIGQVHKDTPHDAALCDMGEREDGIELIACGPH
jgi:hypothetical protein